MPTKTPTSPPTIGRRWTIREVANRFGVAVDTVTRWIEEGELRALNVASTSSKLPRWSISDADIEAFTKARQTKAAV
jgi:excisionase family DNA binding protein